jgi:hypothetical protein
VDTDSNKEIKAMYCQIPFSISSCMVFMIGKIKYGTNRIVRDIKIHVTYHPYVTKKFGVLRAVSNIAVK